MTVQKYDGIPQGQVATTHFLLISELLSLAPFTSMLLSEQKRSMVEIIKKQKPPLKKWLICFAN